MSPTKLGKPNHTHLKGPGMKPWTESIFIFFPPKKKWQRKLSSSLSTWATLIYWMFGRWTWIPRPDFLPLPSLVLLIPHGSGKGDCELSPTDISNSTGPLIEAELRFLTLRTNWGPGPNSPDQGQVWSKVSCLFPVLCSAERKRKARRTTVPSIKTSGGNF